MTDLPFERCADCETVCAGCRFAHSSNNGMAFGVAPIKIWNVRAQEPQRHLMRRLSTSAYLCVCMGAILLGCTVTPRQVVSHSPSLDGTNRNSGLIGFSESGDCVLTEHAKQRYDSLVRRFGDRFEVPIREGEGLRFGGRIAGTNLLIAFPDGTNYWYLDPEHCADFETMTRWSISPQ